MDIKMGNKIDKDAIELPLKTDLEGRTQLYSSETVNWAAIIDLIKIILKIKFCLQSVYNNLIQYTDDNSSITFSSIIQNLELILEFIAKNFPLNEFSEMCGIHTDEKKKLTDDEPQAGREQFLAHIERASYKSFFFEQQCEKYRISAKEQDTIRLLLKGHLYKEIKHELNISLNTLKERVKNIYRKCNVQNKMELANLFNGFNN